MWQRRVGTAVAVAGAMGASTGMNSACCFHFLTVAGITCQPGRGLSAIPKVMGKVSTTLKIKVLGRMIVLTGRRERAV
jgi:hypothetical protein